MASVVPKVYARANSSSGVRDEATRFNEPSFVRVIIVLVMSVLLETKNTI